MNNLAPLLLLLPTLLAAAPSTDPTPYQKKNTWPETFLASSKPSNSPPPSSALPDFGAAPFTISLWVKTSHDGTLLAKAPATGNWAPQGKSLFIRNGKLCYDIGWSGTFESRKSITDNQWHSIRLTGPNDYTIHIDGQLDSRHHLPAESDPPDHVLRVGYTSPNFPETPAFQGLLADLRITTSKGKEPADTPLLHFPFDAKLQPLSARTTFTKTTGHPAFADDPSHKSLSLDGKSWLEISDPNRSSPIAQFDPSLWNNLLRDFPATLDFDRILFVRRKTFQSSHYYTDYIDGCEHYGGNLSILSLRTGKVTDLVPQLNGGIFGRFDLSFDAKRVVFDYKKSPESGFRIYQVNIDGTDLRQLTFPPPNEAQLAALHSCKNSPRGRTYLSGTDDLHPCYLPDGGICFVSTRCQFGILCDGPDILTTTILHRMEADGSNIRPLTNSSVSESCPTITNDGRILYTRWEYVDKGGSAVKCLWAVRPDGTGSVEIFGNDIPLPDTFHQARAIPGHNNLFVCIGAPHMPLGVGTVLRLDINHPIRTRQPMQYMTPEIDIRAEWGFVHNRAGKWITDTTGPFFMDPFPLSDRFFLVACNPDQPWQSLTAYALTLLDETGRRSEIYRDPDYSCWLPTPLRARPTPPILPSPPSPSASPLLFMSNVYDGLRNVKPGVIKYLRILEQVPRPWSARRAWPGDEHGQQHAVISKDAALGLKILHGVVPVESDGSAYFTVPADKNIFFQALDENYMEVQRMRTYINLRPGEARSCIGCHEPREHAPANTIPLAWRSKPHNPQPQPGDTGPRPLHYPTDIQPILDQHCTTCHSGSSPKAHLDLTAAPTTLFSRSYENLLERGVIQYIGEIHPKTGNIETVPPYTLGSHASKLVAMLKKGHHRAKLSPEQFIKLVTWIDSNAQYYGSYFGRRNLKYQDLPDFRPVPTFDSASGIPPLFALPRPASPAQ